DYDDEEEELRPSTRRRRRLGSAREAWRKVRTGLTLVLTGVFVQLGALVLFVLAIVVIGVGAISALGAGGQPPSGGGAAGGRVGGGCGGGADRRRLHDLFRRAPGPCQSGARDCRQHLLPPGSARPRRQGIGYRLPHLALLKLDPRLRGQCRGGDCGG